MNEREQSQEQPALPDMELVNFIESMSIEDRIGEKRRLLSEISDRESLIRIIDDVNHSEGKGNVDIIY